MALMQRWPAAPLYRTGNAGKRPIGRSVCAGVVLILLLLLAACSGGTGNTQRARSSPTPTPTAQPGQQLLAQSAQLLNTARTLHGVFDATISGQFANGELQSEVWRMAPDKSRTLVLKSTLSQFSSGTLIVSDGRTVWQYEPAKKLVYTGPASSSGLAGTPVPGVNQAGGQSLIFSVVQMIFTDSAATLVSSSDTVNGRPVYTIHVSPGSANTTTSSSGLNFNYDGTISLDKRTRLPLALDLNVAGLAQAHIAIPSLTLNQPLAANLFTFTPPPGTTVQPFPPASGQDDNSLTLQQAEQQAGYHLLSIPASQTAYRLQSIDALGAPGNQIYTLSYSFAGGSFTISEGKSLANLPLSGQSVSVRGTTATLSTTSGVSTLSWTERSVGIQITGPLTQNQVVGIAKLLT